MGNRARTAQVVAGAAIMACVGMAMRAQLSGHDHPMMPVHIVAGRPRASVEKYKRQVTRQGNYSCCVNPTCDFCAVHLGGCPCARMAAIDEPVCRECKGGWEAGEGVISGKTAADIKVTPARR